MAAPSIFDQYREARRRAFEKMASLRLQVDEWLERHEKGSPELLDLAQLEAMHAERERCVADLEAAEKRLIESLLARRKTKGEDGETTLPAMEHRSA